MLAGVLRNRVHVWIHALQRDRQAVESSSAAESVEKYVTGDVVDTGSCVRATARRVPSRSCPQPCGRVTTPGRIASVTSIGTTVVPASDPSRAMSPVASVRDAASVG